MHVTEKTRNVHRHLAYLIAVNIPESTCCALRLNNGFVLRDSERFPLASICPYQLAQSSTLAGIADSIGFEMPRGLCKS